MSYAVSSALQRALYQRLASDPGVTALAGGAIFDKVPAGIPPATYVSLGPEDVRQLSDVSGGGAEHRLLVSVVTSEAGFQVAKDLAGAISDALDGAPLTLTRGRLVGLRFLRARAIRTQRGDTRRIDLSFRARVEVD